MTRHPESSGIIRIQDILLPRARELFEWKELKGIRDDNDKIRYLLCCGISLALLTTDELPSQDLNGRKIDPSILPAPRNLVVAAQDEAYHYTKVIFCENKKNQTLPSDQLIGLWKVAHDFLLGSKNKDVKKAVSVCLSQLNTVVTSEKKYQFLQSGASYISGIINHFLTQLQDNPNVPLTSLGVYLRKPYSPTRDFPFLVLGAPSSPKLKIQR